MAIGQSKTVPGDKQPIKTVAGDKQPITTSAGDKFVLTFIPVLCMYQKVIILCGIFLLAENLPEIACLKVIKLLSCSTQLSKKFQLLLKTKIPTNKEFLALSLSVVVFIMLINVKTPTIVGILTFMSRINFVLS